MTPSKKHPDSVPWLKYYILNPILYFIDCVRELIDEGRSTLFGGWHCEYCGKTHYQRTLKWRLKLAPGVRPAKWVIRDKRTAFDPTYPEDRFVCSLGREALEAGTWQPGDPSLGEIMNAQLHDYKDALDIIAEVVTGRKLPDDD